MTPEQWQRVKILFGVCLDTPSHLRNQVLTSSHESEEIRDEVLRLLGNFDAAGDEFLKSLNHGGPAGTDASPLLDQGDVLSGRFQIERFLGAGGMGEVYEASDLDVGERVALKIIGPKYQESPEFSLRLRRELQLARRVTHPNVCRVYDLDRHSFPWGPIEFLTMELLQGETLSSWLAAHGPYQAHECAGYLRQILSGLQAAHDAGVLHRDLKPANVMVVAGSSGAPRLVLMDFGLARASSPERTNLTQTHQVMGTLAYMAPEQRAGGRVSPSTDLYAFGVIMFELLHGTPPYSGTDATKPRESAGKIPSEWAEVMNRCLHADPLLRPASAQEVSRALDVPEKAIAELGRDQGFLSRRRWVFAAGAAAASAAAAVLYRNHRGPEFKPGSELVVAGAFTRDGNPVAVQIRAALRQSNRALVWDNSRVGDTWARMGRKGEPTPSTRDWREIAMRNDVKFVLFPSVTEVGDGASLTLRLEFLEGGPDTPGHHWQASFEAAERQHLFDAIDAGTRWIRGLIGESSSDISKSSASPHAVTTPSWDALKEYSRGEGLSAAGDREGAVLAFVSATRLDPSFTMAWMRIGDVQTSFGRENEAYAAWKRAADVGRERPLTRREDLRFRGMLASDCGDYSAAEKLFKEYVFYFPNEWYGSFYRAFPLILLGRHQESIAELERCVSFERVRLSAWLQLGFHYMYANNRTAAEHSVAKLRDLGSAPRAAFTEAVLAHVSGDIEQALDALRRAASDSGLLPRSKETLSRAIVLADGGRTVDALDALRAGAEEDATAGQRDRWAAKSIGIAALRDTQGDRKGAVQAIRDLARIELGPTMAGWAGVLFARFGHASQAAKFLASIPASMPYPRFQIPRLRIQSEMQLASGETRQALDTIRQAAALEPSAFGSIHLAECLEHAGLAAEALSEYRDYLRAKCFQLHLATPAPAGSFYRAAAAVRRLETQLHQFEKGNYLSEKTNRG